MIPLSIPNKCPVLYCVASLWFGLLCVLTNATAVPATEEIRADIAVLDDVHRSVIDRVHAARRLLRHPLNVEITAAVARNIAMRELPTWDDSWDRLGASRTPVQSLLATIPEGMDVWTRQALDADEANLNTWINALSGFQETGHNPLPALHRMADTPARRAALERILPQLPEVFGKRELTPTPQADIAKWRDEIAAHTIENEKTYREENHLPPGAALPFPIPGNTGLQRHSPGTPAIPPPRQEAGTEQITALSHPTPRGPTAKEGSFWSHSWVWLAMASLLGAFALALKQLRKARR